VAIAGPNSGLFTNTLGAGRGGDVVLQAPTIQLTEDATISARSTGTGTAGTIRIQAGEHFHSHHGRVTTTTVQAGGGTLALQAGKLVYLSASELTTSVRGGGGDAGNLSITSPFTILEGSQIRANAFEGQGGNIQIWAQQAFLADPASLVSASSERGINGQVDIQAPVKSISGTVAPLPQAFAQAAALLRNPCAARLHAGTVSTLVERGRAGTPASPDGLLPSRFPLAPLDTAIPTHAGRLPHAALLSSLGESQPDPRGVLPRHGWAAPADALRLLDECAAR
jgi:hypothetical protein